MLLLSPTLALARPDPGLGRTSSVAAGEAVSEWEWRVTVREEAALVEDSGLRASSLADGP